MCHTGGQQCLYHCRVHTVSYHNTGSLGGGASHISLGDRESGKGQTILNTMMPVLHFGRKTEMLWWKQWYDYSAVLMAVYWTSGAEWLIGKGQMGQSKKDSLVACVHACVLGLESFFCSGGHVILKIYIHTQKWCKLAPKPNVFSPSAVSILTF